MEEEIKVESEVKEETQEEVKEEIQEEKQLLVVETNKEIKCDIDKTKSVSEQAKDLVSLAATKKAVEDEELVENITEIKKEELKEAAQTSLREEQAKAKDSEKKLQEANFGVYQGIADLIGLKKPLPNAMLKILMVILMPVLIVYYVIFGLIAGMVNITMDCINAVFGRFADFTKPARRVIFFTLIVFIAVAIVLVIIFLLKKYNVIK